MTPQEITQIIDILAERLGPMAEVVWVAYVRQTQLHGWAWLGIAVILLAITTVCLGAVLKAGRDLRQIGPDAESSYEARYAAEQNRKAAESLLCCFGGVGCCSLVLFIYACAAAMMRLANPSFYAIQALLGR